MNLYELKKIELLQKKNRELDFFYTISKKNQNNSLTIEEFVQLIADLIPGALKHQGHSVKITFADKSYYSVNHSWQRLSTKRDIKSINQILGKIEIFHKNKIDMSEDNDFIISVAERIAKISERLRVKDELKRTRDQLRNLIVHQQQAKEDERQSIAREIHDELGQVLTAIKINLSLFHSTLASYSEPEIKSLEEEVKGMENLLDKSVKKVRQIITQLRPEALDKLGLIEAIHWLIHENEKTMKINFHIFYDFDDLKFKGDKELVIFRICQEALTNIVRHSGAENVYIDMKCNSSLFIMIIEDDGKGIKKENMQISSSFGILGMKERALSVGANFKILPGSKSGTKIIFDMPINKAG